MANNFVLSQNNPRRHLQSICAIVIKGNFQILHSNPNIIASLTETNVNKILIELSSNTSLSFTFFQWLHSHTQFAPSLHSTWTMLRLLASSRSFAVARKLLDTSFAAVLREPSLLAALLDPLPDPGNDSRILSWVITLLARPNPNRNPARDAMGVFELMRSRGLRPDEHACTAILSALTKSRLTATAWKVYGNMVRMGVMENTHIFNVLLHVCYVSSDIEKAEGLVREMELKGVRRDVITYNTMIALYCKKGMHYEALCAEERMGREGIKQDIVTYNSLIHGFCKEGRMREAIRMFREIKGAVPNHVTYTTLIDGFCRVNDLEGALGLREEMEAKGLYPGVVTYNSIIRKMCELGRMKDANELLNEMDERKIKADNVTCNTFINAYCKRGNMGTAWRLRNKMLELGLTLDQFTYKALIHGFCKIQELDEAKKVLFDMMDAGFSPNCSIYSWLVDGYCNQNNEDAVVRIPDELTKKGFFVDKSIYRALVRRLCKRGLVDSAQKIFIHMQGKGLSGDALLYSNLVYGYLSVGKPVQAYEMLNDMVNKRLVITAQIYSCLCASYSDESGMLEMLWDHASEKGLIAKNVYRLMQQTRKDALKFQTIELNTGASLNNPVCFDCYLLWVIFCSIFQQSWKLAADQHFYTNCG